MAPRLRYAHQQFLAAVECLATGEGLLRQRIASAWPIVRTIVPEDLDGRGDLQERHILLLDTLPGNAGLSLDAPNGDPAALAECLAAASEERVAAIADYIFAMFLTLHRLAQAARE